ncbi:hypothetical protein [Streptomyces sp. NPDC013181]|uniref:hypothetical protein n=1 Tax=Streptomyces sp. NPDC013181 TaxID=3364864 RepID=UPI00368E4DB8
MWELIGAIALLLCGPLVAWTAWEWWRHPEKAPGWMTWGPSWGVRWWAVGFVIVGLAMGAGGVYGIGLAES